MKSACPMGAPRTVSPCSVGGRAGLPTQTSEPNDVRLGGSWPAPSHTLVLPVQLYAGMIEQLLFFFG